jgi:hypothetical protein
VADTVPPRCTALLSGRLAVGLERWRGRNACSPGRPSSGWTGATTDAAVDVEAAERELASRGQ